VSTHLDQRLNASKAEVIPDRWIIGGGLYMSMRTKSLNLEGRSGEGFLVNGNQTRVSRS
jgi:hypothetical protein